MRALIAALIKYLPRAYLVKGGEAERDEALLPIENLPSNGAHVPLRNILRKEVERLVRKF